jgi:hypothetical protein
MSKIELAFEKSKSNPKLVFIDDKPYSIIVANNVNQLHITIEPANIITNGGQLHLLIDGKINPECIFPVYLLPLEIIDKIFDYLDIRTLQIVESDVSWLHRYAAYQLNRRITFGLKDERFRMSRETFADPKCKIDGDAYYTEWKKKMSQRFDEKIYNEIPPGVINSLRRNTDSSSGRIGNRYYTDESTVNYYNRIDDVEPGDGWGAGWRIIANHHNNMIHYQESVYDDLYLRRKLRFDPEDDEEYVDSQSSYDGILSNYELGPEDTSHDYLLSVIKTEIKTRIQIAQNEPNGEIVIEGIQYKFDPENPQNQYLGGGGILRYRGSDSSDYHPLKIYNPDDVEITFYEKIKHNSSEVSSKMLSAIIDGSSDEPMTSFGIRLG